MSDFATLGVKPPHIADDAHFGSWFAHLAERLLNGIDLLVGGDPYRIAEIEMYYYGPAHADPFSHRNPIQLHAGRWYFHRIGDGYRGGSFKGVDLTLGDGTATFGVLLRTIIAPQGDLIDGPSLLVDHLLTRTNAKDVAALDTMLGERLAWDATAPLALRIAEPPRSATVYSTPRVGLSLKRRKPDMERFVMRPYRYLTELRRISKGRPQLVLALHQQGMAPAAIHQLTGVPRKAIDRYITDFTAGTRMPDLAGYAGKNLTTAELCKLIGYVEAGG